MVILTLSLKTSLIRNKIESTIKHTEVVFKSLLLKWLLLKKVFRHPIIDENSGFEI